LSKIFQKPAARLISKEHLERPRFDVADRLEHLARYLVLQRMFCEVYHLGRYIGVRYP
jgi:hypothetical protein